MSAIDKLVIRLTCTYVGSDEFGNSYYESKKVNPCTKRTRYVVYFDNKNV